MTAPLLGHAVAGSNGAWRAFTLDPAIAAALLAASLLYARGHARMGGSRRSAGRRRVTAFVLGEAVVAMALLSPIDAISDDLFSMHMVQHLLLIVAAAPLLVVGRPGHTMMASLPSRWRRLVVGRPLVVRFLVTGLPLLRLPAVAWTAFTLSLWLWHLPVVYEAAVETPWLHAIEHLAFLGTSMLVWSIALEHRRREGLGVLGRALFLLATAAQSGVLGALLLFASTPLYSVHRAGAAAWGLTPLQDQQLAGALMWIPPSVVYLTAAAAMLLRWFRWMGTSEAAHPVQVEGAP